MHSHYGAAGRGGGRGAFGGLTGLCCGRGWTGTGAGPSTAAGTSRLNVLPPDSTLESRRASAETSSWMEPCRPEVGASAVRTDEDFKKAVSVLRRWRSMPLRGEPAEGDPPGARCLPGDDADRGLPAADRLGECSRRGGGDCLLALCGACAAPGLPCFMRSRLMRRRLARMPRTALAKRPSAVKLVMNTMIFEAASDSARSWRAAASKLSVAAHSACSSLRRAAN